MTGKTTNFTIATWANIPTTSEKGCLIHVGAANGSDGYSLGIGGTTFDNVGNNLIFEACPNQWTVLQPIGGTGWHHLAAVINDEGDVAGFVDAGSDLDLPRVPWEGGPSYWAQFAKANAAGWTSPNFFPIAVFLGKDETEYAEAFRDVGINTYMAAQHGTAVIANITSTGMFVMASPDNPYTVPPETTNWEVSEIGSDPKVVGWFVCDEPDIGLGGYIGTDDETGWLAALQALTATHRALADGRFMFSNFSQGIFNTFWSANTFDEMVAAVDGCSVDAYAYTRPLVNSIYADSTEWTSLGGTLANSQSSAAYGWQMTRLAAYQPATRKPFWPVIETKLPYLDEAGNRIIVYAQIEGAVWSAIAHEARGLCYFEFNGFYSTHAPAIDPNTGIAPTTENDSLFDGPSGLISAVTAINSRVAALAPVINTQSYVFNFGATGVDTMLKVHGGFAYIFASLGIAAATGSKTFTLTGSGISGTSVEVLQESRSISVTGGQFSDSFANEYSHHVYKVAI